jgi:hypothetical protein
MINIIDNFNTLLDWDIISYNSNITLDIINKNLDKPWNMHALSQHQNITMKDVNNLNLNWHYGCMSSNPNLTEEMIINNLDKRWNIDELSVHNNITPEFIINTFNYYYDNAPHNASHSYLSYNPNLSFELINSNLYNFDWCNLSVNTFSGYKKQFINKKIREYMAAFKIQQWFLNISVDIKYKYARDRVNRYYDDYYHNIKRQKMC